MRNALWLRALFVAVVAFRLVEVSVHAQAGLAIYSEHLVNGFQDWSWAQRDLANTSPVHSGSQSISVNSQDWEALSFYHPDFDTTLYSNLSFWINGGNGGQVLQVQAQLSLTNTPNTFVLSKLPSNTWQQIIVPLTSLGVENKTNFDRFWIQLTPSGTTNTFYVDDLQLGARPAPASVHITVNAAQPRRTVDSRWFGINTAAWDNNFDTPQTASLLNELGMQALRFPGGSLSDEYHWATDTTDANTWTWATSFANFVHIATNIGAQAMITVNYGTGTPFEAALWVRSANVTNHYGFKYWEIGNECYGPWETDSNTSPHDAYTYATRAKQYIQLMKQTDPTIRIGVVVSPGETNFDNGYTAHPAYNPRTGQTNYGWTAVLLSTLKSLGVTPDFVIHHRYPEYTGTESDPFLLQGTGGWAWDAADLRQQLTDYFGPGGTNIEILCTENNSNAGAQGKQSVSLVNGLYYADSLAQLMQTEINAYFWWDLRNGLDTTGNQDPVLYGWRTYGDLGMLDGLGDVLTNRCPEFFTAKLMQYFARGGDSILTAGSDYALLTSYAARRADGALTLLVINKDPVANIAGQINVSGFMPASLATVHSYGIPQDNAAKLGVGSPDIAQTNFSGAAANFNYAFAPYSVTVITLSPPAPKMVTVPSPAGSLIIQLQGQIGVRYVMQTSADLKIWTPMSTNTLLATSLNFTNNTASTVSRFWRAVWQP